MAPPGHHLPPFGNSSCLNWPGGHPSLEGLRKCLNFPLGKLPPPCHCQSRGPVLPWPRSEEFLTPCVGP